MDKYMKFAKEMAEKNLISNDGGPFGAIIIDSNGEIISTGNNQVLKRNDPTAHAEIVAIRNACLNLNTYDLTGYTLYTSCEPCPMCLSAIIWANIKNVYYACTRNDAESIGFRDNMIYDYLAGKRKDIVKLHSLDRSDCIELFEKYRKNNNIIY